MNLTQEEILLILKVLKESEFEELDLRMGSLTVKARRKGAAAPNCPSPICVTPLPDPLSRETVPPRPDRLDTLPRETGQPQEPEQEEGLVAIKAPILGTFYRRPSPKEPPFVEVGGFVKEDDTVCLIEVMKVFSTVKAGISGRIQKVCAESGELVEFEQVLFLVKPGADDRDQGNV